MSNPFAEINGAQSPISYLFSLATNKTDVAKEAEILEVAQNCFIRDLNTLIADLNRKRSGLNKQAYILKKVSEILSDDVRRRAEKLESS